MYGQVGKAHPGHDCFVFRRDAYQHYRLGRVCIGMAWVAKALLVNMAYFATRFQIFTDKHLTFHIGDPRPWASPVFADYLAHNHHEFKAIRNALQAEYGALVTRLAPGSNLPQMLEPMLEQRRPWFKLHHLKMMVKRVTPDLIYGAAKKVYRTLNPVREKV